MAYGNIICGETRRFLLTIVLTISVLLEHSCVNGKPKVPCFFIFGDSLADNGNNNKLITLVKSNFYPYGIDSSIGATGRFTNNRTTVDFIAELLGFKRLIPPFATAKGNGDIKSGLNYASAAAGIREESGKDFGDNISFNKQLHNHEITISRLRELFGNTSATTNYLNKCLYYLEFGSNDYLNNYFLPASVTRFMFTSQQYSTALITEYSSQIRTLYRLGARKIVISGVAQLGCTPYAISSFSDDMSSCADQVNDAVQLFNAELLSLVDRLNNDLTDAKVIFIGFYEMQATLDHAAVGIKVIKKACCATGIGGLCSIRGISCKNRSEYMFYDEYHPTDLPNRITATRSYIASVSSDAYPYDISHLVAL